MTEPYTRPEGHSLEPYHLPEAIGLAQASGMTFRVTIVDERGDFTTHVTGCVNEDDALDAVTPYVNSNFLKAIRIKQV